MVSDQKEGVFDQKRVVSAVKMVKMEEMYPNRVIVGIDESILKQPVFGIQFVLAFPDLEIHLGFPFV